MVAQTKPNSEKRAAENLTRQGYGFYLPLVGEFVGARGLVGRQRMLVPKPLFRGYIFVEVSQDSWYPLMGTFGLLRLVMNGSTEPAFLPEGTIERLKGREDARGLLQLPPRPAFVEGDRVRVNDGAFKGQVGIYQGLPHHARVCVLFAYLGRKTSVLIAEDKLEAA